MFKRLSLVIEKIILPQFPQIKDFEIKVSTSKDFSMYKVIYFIGKIENLQAYKIMEETESLFKMTSPESKYDSITISFERAK